MSDKEIEWNEIPIQFDCSKIEKRPDPLPEVRVKFAMGAPIVCPGGPPPREDELKIGQEILVPSLLGGYHVMTVKRFENSEQKYDWYAFSEHLVAYLKFENGEWIAKCLMNRSALKNWIPE